MKQMSEQELLCTKLYAKVSGWLEGLNYHLAMQALVFARNRHTGTRKDGVTPEFSHQLHMARFLKNLAVLVKNPQRVAALICIHDTVEDGLATLSDVRQVFPPDITKAVEKLSKIVGGEKMPNVVYYFCMLDDVDVCLVKGIDRMHNIESMPGVFTLEKQRSYLEETEQFTLPMLKEARQRYPDHAEAFDIISHILKSYIIIIRKTMDSRLEAMTQTLS